MKRRLLSSLAVVTMTASFTAPAHAGWFWWGRIVYDPWNHDTNQQSLSELKRIAFTLENQKEGTINYYTKNINITNNKMLKVTKNNYDIDASFTWIINKGENEIIPIPDELKAKMDAIHKGDAKAYMANFKDAASYTTKLVEEDPKEIFEGSKARKVANDMLVQSIEMEKESLQSEAEAARGFKKSIEDGQGHGRQLQIANALGVSQINQMLKLRNSMLASESPRAAEAQVAADRDARAIAVSKNMRVGLAKAVSTSKPIASVP